MKIASRESRWVVVVLVVGLLLCGCYNERAEEVASSADPYAMQGERVSTFAWPEGVRGAVSLTFDDARLSQADVGLPLLDEYGVKATFYVSPEPMKKRLDAWKKAVASGHEIGNHSMRHPCTGNFPWARHKALEDYTLKQMAEELAAANAEVEAAVGVRPATFAYPCGQTYVGRGRQLESYVPLVAEMFLAGRGWLGEGANDPGFCDPAQLLGMELDGLDFEAAKKLIDAAAKDGMWLVFAGHEIGEGERQTVRADTLRAICEYAKDPANGIWIDTVENVVRYVQRAQGQRTAAAK